MIRFFATVALLGVMTAVVEAAPKYAVPALGTKKCVVEQDVGQPVTKKNGNNWDVSTTGKYNYDDAWTFKSLKAEIIYTKGAMTTYGPFTTILDESKIGTPGLFQFAFPNLPPPGQGEVMNLKVTITVMKGGQPDETDSHAKQVPMP